MGRRNQLIIAGIVVAIVAAGLWVVIAVLVPSEAELREQAVAEMERRFGITVVIASIDWQLLPAPVVTVRDAKTAQKQPIEIHQFSVYPNSKDALLHRRLSVERLEIEGAVIPTASLAAFRGKQSSATVNRDVVPVEHVRFRDVTWISHTGVPVPIEGEIDFGPHWRPGYAQVRRARFKPETHLTLQRESAAERWRVRVALGNGTADGFLALTTRKNGTMVLSGTLEPRGVETTSATAAANRRSPVSGKVSGHTVVSAEGETAGELGGSLRLRTDFKIAPATLLRFDLNKAMRTVGKDYKGETPLKSVTGIMDLQSTDKGAVVRFTELKAEAGSFTATAEATIFLREIKGHGTLNLVQGVVGIPFMIEGPTQDPKVSVPPGVFAGAAAGTVVLPGVGTVIGARIGGAVGRLFDGKPEPPGTPQTEPTPIEPPPERTADPAQP